MRRFVLFTITLLLACGGDPGGPSRGDAAGTYHLTTLGFDPQGSLPAVDILPRLDGDQPRLVLAPGGEAQLVFEDPATGLVTTVTGSYSTPEDAVRINFGSGSGFRAVLLSRQMTFAAGNDDTLRFDADAPDGAGLERLTQLVPEWDDEQLPDPVAGRLTVVFTRTTMAP